MKRNKWLNLMIFLVLTLSLGGFAFLMTQQAHAQDAQPQAPVSSSVEGPSSVLSTLGTAFIYQGSLTYGGSPANGEYDFTFELYDAADFGAQVGVTLMIDDLTVTSGLFSVDLDFGDVFDGTALWLEIGVRQGGSVGAYTTLTPRQALTASPYALSLMPGTSIQGSISTSPVLQVYNTATTGTYPGVHGATNSSSGSAVGVLGEVTSTSPGGYSTALRGINNGTGGNGIGVWGSQDGSGWGVYGSTVDGRGVYGSSTDGYGVYGRTTASSGTNYGVYGLSSSTDGTGVYGIHGAVTGTTPGVRGVTNSTSSSAVGVLGEVTSTSPGGYSTALRGINNGTSGLGIGVWGSQDGSGWGVYGTSVDGTGVRGYSSSGYAGYFSGDVNVTGSLSKGAGSFKIDHPLDPENQYLYHSFVESPDMMNIYNGNVTLDENGVAWVQMPEWFEALNQDFRYQLTSIGGWGPLYVAQEIKDNGFQIAGGEPGMKVSWQVTGVRHDPYAEANRIPVEEQKSADESGLYLYPELYDQPQEMGLDYQHNQGMGNP